MKTISAVRVSPRIIACLMITLVGLTVIAFDWFPWLRGNPEAGWQWHYEFQIHYTRLIYPILLIALGIVLYRRCSQYDFARLNRTKVTLILTAIIVWFFAFQLSVIHLSEGGLSKIPATVISRWATEFFHYARTLDDYPHFFSHFEEHQAQMTSHCSSYPPGAITCFWLTIQLFERNHSLERIGWKIVTALVPNADYLMHPPFHLNQAEITALYFSSYLLVFLSCLLVIPAFLLGRCLYPAGNPFSFILLFMMIPSLYLFAPQFGGLFPILTLLILWLIHEGELKDSLLRDALAGLVLAGGLFLTLAMGVVGVWGVLYIVSTVPGWKKQSYRILLRLLVFAGIPLVFYLVMDWLGGFSLFDMLLRGNIIVPAATRPDHELRAYSFWSWFNLVDFFLFLGIPCTFFMLWEGMESLRNLTFSGRRTRLLLSFLIVLLGLSFSGIVLSETGRVWLFLMPLPIAWLASAPNLYKSKVLEVCFFLQILQIIIQRISWNVVRLEPGLVEFFSSL